MTPRTSHLSCRVSADLKAATEKAAAAQNRSVTSFIETLVLAYLNKAAKQKDS